MTRIQGFTLFILSLAGMIAAFFLGYLIHETRIDAKKPYPLVQEAYEILQQHAYGKVPDLPKAEYGMIRGLITEMQDPYTSFLEPATHELQSDNLRGEFGGIGVRIDRQVDGTFLLYPLPEGTANKAGILDADELIKVDDLEVSKEMSNDQIQAALRGPIGTRVIVEVRRTVDILTFDLKREVFTIPSVTWNLDQQENRLGVIQISLVAESTPGELIKAIKDLQTHGATHFLLDLRNNPGGVLDAGINLARLFLSTGKVMEQQYKGREIESFEVEKPGPLTDIPLAVLVNGNTASSAEVFAGALKAQSRAYIVGEASFGKDSLQLVFELRDKSSLHVTSAKWWIPELNPPVAGNGVIPDLFVSSNSQNPRVEVEAVIEHFFGTK